MNVKAPAILDHLQSLADTTRSRILLLLERTGGLDTPDLGPERSIDVRFDDFMADELGTPRYEPANVLADDRYFDNLYGQQAYKCFACRVRKA